MSRRDSGWTEEQLARDDERRDAIDRIYARSRREGYRANDIVHAIVRGLSAEMRPLVEIEIGNDGIAPATHHIGPADTALIDQALGIWSSDYNDAPHADIARIRALLSGPGGGS